MRQVLRQVQSYKLLAAKLPVLAEPSSSEQVPSSPKDYRYSAAYLTASDMPAYNLIDIANYALNPTSAELGRKIVDARTALAPGALLWSMEPRDLVQSRIALACQSEAEQMEKIASELDAMRLSGMAEGEPELVKKKLALKRLQLATVQRSARQQVLVHIQQSTVLDASYDTTTYRRHKKQSLREPRMIERAVKEHRVAAKSVQTRKSSDEFLRKLSAQVAKISGQSKAEQQRHIRCAKAVLQYHGAVEKEEQKRQERLAKDRIRALRADDEEAYLKLIDQQKDTRLTHLLKQTDEFLEGLTSRVFAQQQEMSADRAADDGAGEGSKDYYNTAHKIREEVSLQPSLLTGGRLKEYQMKGLQWLVSLYNNHLNGILADEMGLGKTIQAISLIAYLMEHKGQTGPFLIIVPLSTITNWVNEFEKWAPSVGKVEYKGSMVQRKSIQATLKHSAKFNVLITTYDFVIKDRSFLSKFKWLYMIIDEGHRVKNTQSKLVTTLVQHYAARFRLILTGTPLQNNLPELWALLNFVLPRIFNSSKTFEEWFNAPFANTGERVELNEEETLLIIRRLHKVLRPFLLRRMKKDVESELPDKVERVVKCPMSALQHRLYSIVKKKCSTGSSSVPMRRLNNTIMQLRKICNHPFVFDEVEDQVNPSRLSNDLLWRVSGKFELLSRMLPKLQATGHRVLIFFQMTQVMTIFEDFLLQMSMRYMRLDGSTKSEDRSDLLRKFNAPLSDYFIFLLSTRAGGLGLNLQTADTVVIFDSDWNPHQDLQAQDRAHRIGQTKQVRIYRLVTSDSVEECILERAQFKLSLDGKVIQAGKFDHKSTNEEREAMLRALMEGDQRRKEGDEEDVLDEDELNEIMARNDDEMAVFRSMDAERNREWAGRSRLIEEAELPRVYMEEEGGEESSADVAEGRRRMKVSYDESMSDRQWYRSIMSEPSESESLNVVDPQDDDSPEKRPRLQLVFGQRPSRRMCHQIFNALQQDRDEHGRCRSEIFAQLPSRHHYPDYYKVIKSPMAMAQIKAKLDSYARVADMKTDFDRMYDNAMYYNQEGSIVWQDALHLKNVLSQLCQECEDERTDDEDGHEYDSMDDSMDDDLDMDA